MAEMIRIQNEKLEKFEARIEERMRGQVEIMEGYMKKQSEMIQRIEREGRGSQL